MYKKWYSVIVSLFTFTYGADTPPPPYTVKVQQEIPNTTTTTMSDTTTNSYDNRTVLPITYSIENHNREFYKEYRKYADKNPDKDHNEGACEYFSNNTHRYCNIAKYHLFLPTTIPIRPVKPINDIPHGTIQVLSDWEQNDTPSPEEENIPDVACWLTKLPIEHHSLYCGHQFTFYNKKHKTHQIIQIPCTEMNEILSPWLQPVQQGTCGLVKNSVIFDGPDTYGNIVFCINTKYNSHKIYFADVKDSYISATSYSVCKTTIVEIAEHECPSKVPIRKNWGHTGEGIMLACAACDENIIISTHDIQKNRYYIEMLTRYGLDRTEFDYGTLDTIGKINVESAVKKIVCFGNNTYAAIQRDNTLFFFTYDVKTPTKIKLLNEHVVKQCTNIAVNTDYIHPESGLKELRCALLGETQHNGYAKLTVFKNSQNKELSSYLLPNAACIHNIYYEKDSIRVVYNDAKNETIAKIIEFPVIES